MNTTGKEIGRDETLGIPGMDASSLEFMKAGSEISLGNGAKLRFNGMSDGKELYFISGTDEQISANLEKTQGQGRTEEFLKRIRSARANPNGPEGQIVVR